MQLTVGFSYKKSFSWCALDIPFMEIDCYNRSAKSRRLTKEFSVTLIEGLKNIRGDVMEEKQEKQVTETRRDFLKKGAYVAPAVLTLTAVPAFANSGSGKWSGDSSSASSESSG